MCQKKILHKVLKKHFICREICDASKNKSSLRKFNKYDIWELHFGTFVFAMYFSFGISIMEKKRNYRLISNHSFQRKQEHTDVEKNLG